MSADATEAVGAGGCGGHVNNSFISQLCLDLVEGRPVDPPEPTSPATADRRGGRSTDACSPTDLIRAPQKPDRKRPAVPTSYISGTEKEVWRLVDADNHTNWRKYGQKITRDGLVRSYYRCTKPDCTAKKRLEARGRADSASQDVRILMSGHHNHQAKDCMYPSQPGSPQLHNEDCWVVTNEKLQVICTSQSFLKLTQYTHSEVLGCEFPFVDGKAASQSQSALNLLRDAFKEPREICIPCLNYRKDGSNFCNTLRLTPTIKDGILLSWLGLHTDVSDPADSPIAEGLLKGTKRCREDDSDGLSSLDVWL